MALSPREMIEKHVNVIIHKSMRHDSQFGHLVDNRTNLFGHLVDNDVSKRLRALFERADASRKQGRAYTWKAISEVFLIDESTLRRAYAEKGSPLPEFIKKHGRGYELNLGALTLDQEMRLDGFIMNRRHKPSSAKSVAAKNKARAGRARFAKDTLRQRCKSTARKFV
jgi:hypothetical protein